MSNTENIKKKHYLFFQAYLSEWKDESNVIWVLKDGKKIFPIGTEEIALKNSFYTIEGIINLEEKKFLDCYLSTMHPLVREQLEVFIQDYLLPIQNQKVIDTIKKSAIDKFSLDKYMTADIQESIKQCEYITTVTLLHNKTSIPFVTSDQAIINIKSHGSNDLLKTTELIFYYPISPTKALLINGEYVEKEVEITEKEVNEYNSAIVKASSEFIIANDQKVLEQFMASEKSLF